MVTCTMSWVRRRASVKPRPPPAPNLTPAVSTAPMVTDRARRAAPSVAATSVHPTTAARSVTMVTRQTGSAVKSANAKVRDSMIQTIKISVIIGYFYMKKIMANY